MSKTTFVDYANRSWNLALNFARLQLLKTEKGVDLLNLHKTPEVLEQLEQDPFFLVDVISILLTEDIKTAGLTAETFADGLVKDGCCQPVLDAVAALMEAIQAFSPPEKARALKTLWTKTQTLTQTTLRHMSDRAEERYPQIEQAALRKMDQEFDTHLAEIFGSSLTSGVVSSGSPTPDITHSDS
ncbi:hypothetical protein SH661x_001945 [Planctomicrobium sp. SH661]|uniref:hypothetical protein n=1 Tax=Planctomicrobium sp. SH661 TaxID=3448124 RepID=UPI003F5B1694